MSQVPEESYTQAQFRNTFKSRYEFTNVTILGSDSSGTHFYWDDARGERHFGVISDLLVAKIVRTGTVSITLGANSLSTLVNETIDPPLPNTTSFRAWANQRQSTATLANAQPSVRISSTTNLQVRAARSFASGNISPTNLTATYSSDTQIDVGLGHQHASDVNLAADHSHLLTLTIGSIIVQVDWWISSLAE